MYNKMSMSIKTCSNSVRIHPGGSTSMCEKVKSRKKIKEYKKIKLESHLESYLNTMLRKRKRRKGRRKRDWKGMFILSLLMNYCQRDGNQDLTNWKTEDTNYCKVVSLETLHRNRLGTSTSIGEMGMVRKASNGLEAQINELKLSPSNKMRNKRIKSINGNGMNKILLVQGITRNATNEDDTLGHRNEVDDTTMDINDGDTTTNRNDGEDDTTTYRNDGEDDTTHRNEDDTTTYRNDGEDDTTHRK